MPDLYALYRLHKIDAAIVELKKRAAAFDPNREVREQMEALKPLWEQTTGKFKFLENEEKELELEQKGLDEKIAKFDKELYGGKVVNPKEIASIEKEIELLKSKRSSVETRLLEIYDELPEAKKQAEEPMRQMTALQNQAKTNQQEALTTKQKIEDEYKKLVAERSSLAKEVDRGLLAQYEAIRAKQGGIGMAEVTDKGTCARCGTVLPTKTVIAAKEDRLVTCESCHRILFNVMPPE